MEKIKVLLVEDDAEWQQALSVFFREHDAIELSAVVSTAKACMDMLERERFDVVLMDIMLDDYRTGGLDATLEIRCRHPDVRVIMLTSLDSDDEVFNEAFMNGAYEYIYKYDFDQLPDAIMRARQNPHSKYGDRLRKLVYEQKRRMLTPTDLAVLRGLARSMSLREIAEEQHVGLSAVKKQLNRLFHKFGWTGTGRELAEKCKKWGLLDEDGPDWAGLEKKA
jgi:DNA-binding NarL/FixJ family response regulator